MQCFTEASIVQIITDVFKGSSDMVMVASMKMGTPV